MALTIHPISSSEPQRSATPDEVLFPPIATKVTEASKARLRFTHLSPKPNWYRALRILKMLPKTIPPLPSDIQNILAKNDPKPCYLYLLPPGSVKQLAARCRKYGQRFFKPNHFRFVDPGPVHKEHCNIKHQDFEWMLWHPDVILKGSRNRATQDQFTMVDALGGNYKVPTIRQAVGFAFLHKMATGETIFQPLYNVSKDRDTYNRYTFTHVQEKSIGGDHCEVGHYQPHGIVVSAGVPTGMLLIGIGAVAGPLVESQLEGKTE
jgi:hypothetical protein